MASRSNSVESLDEYDFVLVDDLSVWEFINVSNDDDYDVEDLEIFSLSDTSSVSVENLLEDVLFESEEADPQFGSPSSDMSIQQSPLAELQLPLKLDHICEDQGVGARPGDGRYGEYDNYEEEEEVDNYEEEYDYDDGYYLDDELVPLEVGNKFGRQRIRKLGKRSCPRMNKSKKLPYKYNRPGCVHGKHGLGVQHAYI